jgi:uncharacterized protein YdaU (DUF1376 family)
MNYYNHHIGDFKKDTSFLDHVHRSIYLELIWMYYDQEKPLPNDVDLLATKVQGTVEQVKFILKIFFTKDEDTYRHSRIDEELEAVYRKSEAARKSAEARWNKGSMRSHTDGNANGMLPNTQDPKPSNKSKQKKEWSEDPAFMDFWDTYEHKTGAVEAYKVWKRDKCAEKLDTIKKHIKFYHTTDNWKKGYRKDPRTYLNQKMYLDPITKAKVKYDWEGAK